MRFPFVPDPVEVRANILKDIGKRSLGIAKGMMIITAVAFFFQIWSFLIIFIVFRNFRNENFRKSNPIAAV